MNQQERPRIESLRVIKRLDAERVDNADASSPHRNYLANCFLAKQIHALREAIRSEQTYPKRKKLLKRFRAIESAAKLLRDELRDQRLLALMGDRWFPSGEFMAGLDSVAERATSVIKRNLPKQGRAKLYPDGPNRGPSPQQRCALFVGMMWQRRRGRWPPLKNKRAHRLCEIFWKAAGGPPRSGWGRDGQANVTVWRTHLKAAQEFRPPHPAGTLVQVHFLGESLPRRLASARSRPRNFYDHPVSIANRVKKKTK